MEFWLYNCDIVIEDMGLYRPRNSELVWGGSDEGEGARMLQVENRFVDVGSGSDESGYRTAKGVERVEEGSERWTEKLNREFDQALRVSGNAGFDSGRDFKGYGSRRSSRSYGGDGVFTFR
jgi:hypothetical protein